MLAYIAWALGTIAATFIAWQFVRAFCRVYAVEERKPAVWVAARPLGIVAGTIVWMGMRAVSPEVTAGGSLPGVVAAVVMTAVCLAGADIALQGWIIDEVSYPTAREMYLEHGSDPSSGTLDWIDVSTDAELREEVSD